MKTKNIEFPNPVLADGRDDYVSCSFNLICDINTIKIDKEKIIIPIRYSLVSDGLSSIVKEGVAKVITVLQSPAASFRRVIEFPLNQTFMEICLNRNEVIKNIEIIGYIVASKKIPDFSLADFNKEYFGGIKFNIRKGDILAQEYGYVLTLDDSELEKPLTSIFNISEKNDLGVYKYKPYFYSDKIEIYMLNDSYEAYCKLKMLNNGVAIKYINGIVILPALTEAICKVVNSKKEGGSQEEISEFRWFKAIEKKSKELGIDLYDCEEEASTIASRMLGDGVFSALVSLREICDEMTNGEEVIMESGGID